MKKVIEGYLGISGLFGAYVVKEYKKVVSLKDDIFSKECIDFEDKKVTITIETKE